MNLKVIRYEFSSTSTIGDLYVDDNFFSYTLEDRDRQVQNVGNILPWSKELKVQNETAIPHGAYEIIINWSNRFKQPMPLLLNVPDFLGVRVHSGSIHTHTEGCVLIGFTKSTDFIGNSRLAYRKLFPIIRESLKTGKCFITIGVG